MAHGIGLSHENPGVRLASGVLRELDTGAAARVATGPPTSLVPDQRRPSIGAGVRDLDKLITGFDPVSTERPRIERKADAIARRRRERGGRASFEDEPAEAFFFALKEVGAALQGKELPSDKLHDQQVRRAALELKRLQVGLGVIESAAKLCKGKSAEQCEELINSMGAKFEDTLGTGFTETLRRATAMPDPIDLAGLAGDLLPELQGIFGNDTQRMTEFLLDKDNRKFLEGRVDQKNVPVALSKMATVFQGIMDKDPKLVPKDDKGNITFTLGQVEAGCALLPKNACPTSGEFASLRRQPDRVREAFPGFVTPEVQKKRAEAEAGREPIPKAGARAEAVKAGQLKAEAGGARKLGGARTVNTNQDIPLPGGGSIPKGTAITVRPVENKSFSVTSVFSDGKMVEVEIPDAVIPGLTRERKLEAPTVTQRGQIELRIRFLDDALSQLQILKRVVEETPTGAAGEIVKALQGTYDQALTLAETVPGLDALVNITERGIAFIDSSLFKADTPEERDELDNIRRSFLNTNLPAIPIMQEGIAIALAAASFPTTQRIPVEAIKEARKNVDLTGLFGPGRGTAVAKLNTIIARIESNKTFLGQRKTAIEQPTIKGKPVDREERKRRLLEKFGIKPR